MGERLARLLIASGGSLDLVIYDPCAPDGLAELDGLVRSGDPPAIRVRDAVGRVLDAVAAQPRYNPIICPACRRALRRAYSIVVAYSDLARPSDLLGVLICRACAPDAPAVLRQVGKVLRLFWPTTRTRATTDA